MKRTLSTAAALAAACALLAPLATGQGTKPEPGCAGLYADKKGDVEQENLDITGFWFNHAGGKTTANIRIANLTQTLPDESTGMNWYVLWSFEDATRFVQAQVEFPNATGPTYGFGTVNGNIREQASGDVTGQFIEGADGVISIEIPAEIGGTKGIELKAVTADTQSSLGVPGVASALSAVDEASGKPYKIGACEDGGAAPAPGGTPAPGATPAPTPAPGSGPTPGQPSARGQLDVAASKKLPRAKKVKKTLTLAVSSKAGVTDVSAALYKGAPSKGKVAAQGKLAKLKGKGKLKLKVKGKFKKGAYSLVLIGKNADGSTADKTLNLKFK